jgi:hypothetical protein
MLRRSVWEGGEESGCLWCLPYLFSHLTVPSSMMIRILSFSFSLTQIDQPDCNVLWNEYEADIGAGAYHSLTAEERREQVEVWNTNFAEQSCSGVQHTLCEFEGRLDYIHADFADAYCKGGCCRLILECYEFWIQKLVPKVLDIPGLRTGDEAKFEVISGS